MKKIPVVVSTAPSESDIREYAYHLYCQGGSTPGRDLDNWLEAEACLCANIPQNRSHQRLHQHLHGQPAADTAKAAA